MRKNYLNAIKNIDPSESKKLEDSPSNELKAFCDRHNKKISALLG